MEYNAFIITHTQPEVNGFATNGTRSGPGRGQLLRGCSLSVPSYNPCDDEGCQQVKPSDRAAASDVHP